MKINMHIESESSRERQMMIYKLGQELAREYKIHTKHQLRAAQAFTTDENLIPLFVKFVKDKHGLSLSPFNINDGVTTFAVGFDIAEDAYFTKFLLMQ
jgi:hypothetical protein